MFKQCVCKNHPSHHMEYDELKVGNPYVKGWTEKKAKKELIGSGPNIGKWRVTFLERDFFKITHPTHTGPVFNLLRAEAEQYWLVVDHTGKSAFPVLKTLFATNYEKPTPGKKKPLVGTKMEPSRKKTPETKIVKGKRASR